MSYTISYTDSVNKGTITVEDGTLNQDTSLQIPGRNSTSYGTAIGENFLHLLENFASANAPARPVEGQLWYDNTDGVDQLKIYDGTNWVAVAVLKKQARNQQLQTVMQAIFGSTLKHNNFICLQVQVGY